MRFPKKFSRFKGGGTPVLGTDTPPSTGYNPQTMDNVLSSRFYSKEGWPVHRIVVAYQPPSGSLALNADLYFYEANLGLWVKVNTTTPMSLLANALTVFDIPVIVDLPHIGSDINDVGSNSLEALLIVADPGAAPNGEHKFSMAADMTTF